MFSSRLPDAPVAERVQRALPRARGPRAAALRSDGDESRPRSASTIRGTSLAPLADPAGAALPARSARDARRARGRRRRRIAARTGIDRRASCSPPARARPTRCCSSCCAIAGDEVLVPQPSYPLFDVLTRLDSVARGAVPARPARRLVDRSRERRARVLGRSTRAMLVVSPEQPDRFAARGATIATGSSRSRPPRGLAIIADEVFADYPLSPHGPTRRRLPASRAR